jgi:hypothetical protein
MESARRWSGFVCPDCRFVFRVPRDHDGKGIVCPSCRRLLKIPVPGDLPTPLVAPLRRTAAEESPADEPPQMTRKKRRGKKPERGENLEWEHKNRGTRRGEKSQMRMMLIGGGILFALIVAGVIAGLYGGGPAGNAALVPTVLPKKAEPAKVDEAAIQRSESSLAAEAEPLARKFLEATEVEEILPLVRDPGVVESRIRKQYADGKIPAVGFSQFNVSGSGVRRGSAISYLVRTGDQEQKSMDFIDGPGGLKIDWESWVGWSEISWQELVQSKSTTAHVFRLYLSPVEYYNFDFKDDLKWQAYRLESPDQETSIYGYVEKGSMLDKQIRPTTDVKSLPLTLSLRFPEKAASSNQVLIERLVTDGWVEENEKP